MVQTENTFRIKFINGNRRICSCIITTISDIITRRGIGFEGNSFSMFESVGDRKRFFSCTDGD